MERSRYSNVMVLLIIGIIVLLVMLPRLISAQFGFFDDTETILTSRRIINGNWSPGEESGGGRFRPIYWLYYATLYRLAGENPLCFFIGNAILLIISIYLLFRLVDLLTGNITQAWIAAALFFSSGSIIENVYTLSKPELLQVTFLLMSVLSVVLSVNDDRPNRRIGWKVISILSIVLACLTKETALILFPISVLWFILAWLRIKLVSSGRDCLYQIAKAFLVSSCIGSLAYLIMRSFYLPFGLVSMGYSSQYNFDISYILTISRIWLDLLLWDFLYIVPLSIPALLILLRKSRTTSYSMIFPALIWMFIWVAIYIPWQFTQVYYLLPFALGASVLTSVLVQINLEEIRGISSRSRVIGLCCLSLAIVIFVLTIPNNVTNARLQLAVDASNNDMLNYVLGDFSQNAVVVMNIQEINEYVRQFPPLVNQLRGRPDLAIKFFQDVQTENDASGNSDVYYLLPVVKNQFYPSVRMGVYEHTSRSWNQSLLNAWPSKAGLIYRIEKTFRSFSVDSLRLACPLLRKFTYCDVPNTPFDRRVFSYGWDIYRLESTQE